MSDDVHDFVAISAGSHYSLMLKPEGCIIGWGFEGYGRTYPPDGSDFVAIAAHVDYDLALKSDGSIMGWGFSYFGRLVPTDGNDFIAIAAGFYHSLALKSNGSIVGWGYNESGQARPPAGNDFVAITAGFSHSLALKTNGSIVGWGDNRFGKANPPAGNDFVAIAAGSFHSLALKSDGSIVGWGNNPKPPNGNDFIAIAAGANHSLALKSDGSIVGWGHNSQGEAIAPRGNDFIAIAAGDGYSLALRSDGSIVGWGRNIEGQADPPDGNGFVAIAAGPSYGLAIKEAAMARCKAKKEVKEEAKQEVTKEATKEVTEVVEVENTSSLKSLTPLPKTIRLRVDNKMNIDLIYIKPGSFIMGRNVRWVKLYALINFEAEGTDEGPPRKVKITKGFYIGRYEVTAAQFCQFLNAIDNPQDYVKLNTFARIEIKDGVYVPKSDCENCEINVVHWEGAVAFCDWLSHQTGLTIRLPTEAEWEFVARGPEGQSYPWGKPWGRETGVRWTEWTAGEIEKEQYPYAWNCFPDRFPRTVTPDGVVGMRGHIGEWCSDFYGVRYLKNDVIDPQGPREEDLSSVNSSDEKYHVYRRCEVSPTSRSFGNTVRDYGRIGFRIVVEKP